MMEDEIYNIKKPAIIKIENDSLYKRYCQAQAKDIPIDDLRPMLKMFFDKAAVNMGKESYDAPDVAIESIIEFIYKDFHVLPMFYIGMAIIRGSLGKFGPGRLVPATVYKWLHEVTLEYDKYLKHEKLTQNDNSILMDLHKYPVGSAIVKKIDWYRSGIMSIDDWDNVPLKAMAERISQGLECVPEVFGLKSLKPNNK